MGSSPGADATKVFHHEVLIQPDGTGRFTVERATAGILHPPNNIPADHDAYPAISIWKSDIRKLWNTKVQAHYGEVSTVSWGSGLFISDGSTQSRYKLECQARQDHQRRLLRNEVRPEAKINTAYRFSHCLMIPGSTKSAVSNFLGYAFKLLKAHCEVQITMIHRDGLGIVCFGFAP